MSEAGCWRSEKSPFNKINSSNRLSMSEYISDFIHSQMLSFLSGKLQTWRKLKSDVGKSNHLVQALDNHSRYL